MATNRYVKKSASGDTWEVVKEGHRRATAVARTKSEAIRTATSLTRREGGGEIRVMNKTGKMVSANTVSGSNRSPSRAKTRSTRGRSWRHSMLRE
jgi:hypothetical protein